MPRENNALQSLLRLRGWPLVRAVALVAAAAFAFNGARILRASSPSAVPILDNFDEGVLWLGLALLATLIAALDRLRRPSLPGRAALIEFGRAHWAELAIFAGIFAFGVFMRLYRFGDTLPPSNALCCEEHINGGTAYAALHGQRPLLFPLGRWASAGGFLIFGDNQLGLRFFFPVMSIATLVLLYALLRQLVNRQAALFGLALYAAAWWPSLRARQATEGTIYTVLLALLLVRGLKTKSPLAWFGAGTVAGLLSYEYEPFRVVPWIAAMFLVAAALREVVLRAPLRFDAARARASELVRSAWRPALISVLALGIVLTPMAVGLSRGYDLYLTSVHRQTADRGGQRLAGDWRHQAKWAAELFLPFGPKSYPTTPPRDVPGKDLIDPLTGSLAILGVMAGVAFALRGVRGLFVGWFAVSMAAGALVLQNFAPWKFFGLVPVLIVLVALLIDDARSLVLRRYGATGERWLSGCLVVGALFSFGWNANTLFNDVGPSEIVQQSYGSEGSLIYEMCHELRDRPDENASYVFSNTQLVAGFAGPRSTAEEEGVSWGDYIWICHGLHGTALPAPEEAWPIRNVPSGPITLVFGNPPGEFPAIESVLARAYSGSNLKLGDKIAPTRTTIGPAGGYTIYRYDYASGQDLTKNGLFGAYFPNPQGDQAVVRVDSMADLSWDASPGPLTPPFTVTWTGLIYLEGSQQAALVADTTDRASITFDGRFVVDPRVIKGLVALPQLGSGWHTVEITLDKQQTGGSFKLEWLTSSGLQPVAPGDLFPMAQLAGWVHERAIGVPEEPRQLVTTRLDFSPHRALSQVARLATGMAESLLTEDHWRGVWQVDTPGDYRLLLEIPAGDASLLIDGREVATSQGGTGQQSLAAEVALAAGPHAIELDQSYEFEPTWSGATLSAFCCGASPTPVEMNVRPY